LVSFAASTAEAEIYPSKYVTIIVSGAAGGGIDVIARIVADRLTRSWGQQVLVADRPGGGGLISAQAAAMAAPDGHTLYAAAASTFVVMPEIRTKLPFDLKHAFVPVALIGELPITIAVAPSLKVNTLSELISLARQNPEKIQYAANSPGSLPHLTGELLRKRTDINATFIPYPGASQALQDIMGGRLAMIVESISGISGALGDGSLRVLAVGSATRLRNFPQLPTVAETVPGFVAVGWLALVAPTGTPETIIQKINRDLNLILDEPEVRQKLETLGTYARPISPAETGEFILGEQLRWRPVVQQAGLAPQ